jgi:DNA helicase-2/ATP-dependent DNA helicase PcrA
MDHSRVQEYYEELKFYYNKPDSDWTDKAKSMRTIAHRFYNEIAETDTTYYKAMREFYKGTHQKLVSDLAFKLKDQLNTIVHENLKIDKKKYVYFYDALVRLIYLATGVMPDEATQEFIGFKQEDLWGSLNDQQKDIVLNDAKIIYVNAGPGTGKTRLLVHKLLRYIQISTGKEKIVALSYTNTAARELGDRFREAIFKVKIEKGYDFYNGTIHSFCYRMLKSYYASIGEEFSDIIIDDEDIQNLAEEIHVQLEEKYTVNEIAECLRSRLRTQKPGLAETLAEIKKKYSIISIEDILHKFIDICHTEGFMTWISDKLTTLVIDEAQDLTKYNYEIFSLLLGIIPELKLFLVGDPRQNIFSFNGGSYEHLNEFLKKYPQHISKPLTMTYRCPDAVTRYLNTFKFNDCENHTLQSMCTDDGETKISPCDCNETEATAVVDRIQKIGNLNQTAVLCNSMMYLSNLIALLRKNDIPYKVFGGRKYLRNHVKLFNHVLRVIDSDNEYSIRVLDRTFKLNLKGYSGKNITERFYASNFGQKIKDIKDNMERLSQDFHTVVCTVIDEIVALQSDTEEITEDYNRLRELSVQYPSISEYLLSFAIDKETFSGFYSKDYVECQVPVESEYLTVSTIHSAKGLEWENVFILGLSEGNFPNSRYAGDTPEKQVKFYSDEAKKMYVAASRAKKNLFLSYSVTAPWGTIQRPSRFILELHK